jgi:LAO/AO transport system kinase
VARFSIEAALRGLAARERSALSRIITLLESVRTDDRAAAEIVLEQVLALRAKRERPAIRLGITGPPGVGKSTFIEALGSHVLSLGLTVAVLAIDPSSQKTGGSILGDKTRMARLAVEPRAFVRPSSAGAHLGGVAARTREAVLVCEAFGFDLIIVETVGVGQSETDVASMVDTFLLMALPGSGDELQGMKRGIMELCDLVVVNKADGDNVVRARNTAADLRSALKLFGPRAAGFLPRVLLASAALGEGVAETWDSVVSHQELLTSSGELLRKQRDERRHFFRVLLLEKLSASFEAAHRAAIQELESAVLEGRITASGAVAQLFASTSAQG